MRIAVVGSGISGLVAAHLLNDNFDVTLFEAADRLGGHANTMPVPVDGHDVWVDTGFLVYNERNYPGLVGLFAELGVVTDESDMSFSVSDAASGLEWNGTNLDTLFAQRRRIVDPTFLRMLLDVARFNRRARTHVGRLAGFEDRKNQARAGDRVSGDRTQFVKAKFDPRVLCHRAPPGPLHPVLPTGRS